MRHQTTPTRSLDGSSHTPFHQCTSSEMLDMFPLSIRKGVVPQLTPFESSMDFWKRDLSTPREPILSADQPRHDIRRERPSPSRSGGSVWYTTTRRTVGSVLQRHGRLGRSPPAIISAILSDCLLGPVLVLSGLKFFW